MSIDPDLLADLREIAPTVGLQELSTTEAEHVAISALEAFVTVPDATWWWAVLREPVISLRYGEGDGVALLLRLQPPDTRVVLVVTDDEQPPWPAFEGALQDVVAMLREVRVFEFWVAPRDWRWIVFDTHENALVVAGSLVTLARSLETTISAGDPRR